MLMKATVIAGTAVALCAGALVAPSVHAASVDGSYATWTFTSGTAGTVVPNPDPLWPTATLGISGGSGSSASGATTFLNTGTPIGEAFGSSQNRPYASVGLGSSGSVPGTPSVTTITFTEPTPSSGWAFALGDVDAENVQISARDAAGNAIDVSGWFASAFNYCNATSPKPGSCPGGVGTDVPTWSSPTLTGSGTDSSGASAWFRPTSAVKELVLTQSRNVAGGPSYQLWIASTPVRATPAPVEYTVAIDGNDGACTSTSITGVDGSWKTVPTTDGCTRPDHELLGFSTDATATTAAFPPGASLQLTSDNRLYAIWRKLAPEPFLCPADLIQVSGTGGGVLYVYDPTRNTMDLVPEGGGPSRASGANATGYNPADDFIYGIAPRASDLQLWQFGSNGIYEDLGTIVDQSSGAPVRRPGLVAGDFIADDVLLAIQVPDQFLSIDVASAGDGSAVNGVLQTGPRGAWGAADIAVNADRTAGYGLRNRTLYIASLPGGDAATQVAALSQPQTFSQKTVLGVPARGDYGAAYLDQSDNAYFYNNTERRIYLITAAELAKDVPTAVPLGTEKAFVLGTDQTLDIPTDGASCPTAPIVTVTLTYDINGGTGSTPADQTGFADQEVTVADGVGFEREGAVFAGWNTSADGSGMDYTPGALFGLGQAGGVLYAMWAPVESAPVLPPEQILEPLDESPAPAGEGGDVVFTPIEGIPSPPNDPWNPSTLVLIDPTGGNPTPAVDDESGQWSVNNRTGTVTYRPNPAYAGKAAIAIQLATVSGVSYQSELRTQVPSCEVGRRVTATVYFDVLSSRLDAASRRILTRLVQRAEARGVPTCSVVVGFVQPTSRRANDISLSTARASSVADYLAGAGLARIVRAEGLGRADQRGAKARRATATIYIADPATAPAMDQADGGPEALP